MCRLFGFRSVIPSQMHRSLVQADNALGTLSTDHPDGWGVAYYVDGAPHLTRSTSTAIHDHLFHRLSGVVSSDTVLAHVRKATRGGVSMLNTHPFQHGRWVFAHNGDVPELARARAALVERIAPALRRYVIGETDSELVFFLFLSALLETAPLAAPRPIDDAMRAMAAAVSTVRAIADVDAPTPSALTLIATDGVTMVAQRSGRELYWSTHKRRCADRDTCPSLAPHCEAPTTDGRVNHLILSSEPLGGENVWTCLAPDELIGVDVEMRLVRRAPVTALAAPSVEAAPLVSLPRSA
jgi:glutamine amidotransferase